MSAAGRFLGGAARERQGALRGRGVEAREIIELCNGRIIFFKPAQSVAAARAISAMIEEVDPGFRVLGPVVCGIQLPCAATSILK